MGEFGENSNNEKWQKLYQHLKDNDLDWAYWSLDGYKYADLISCLNQFMIQRRVSIVNYLCD